MNLDERKAVTDDFIRRTRPQMARQSWSVTVAYCLGCWVAKGFGLDLFDTYVAMVLSSPAWAYIGVRTGDKFAEAIKKRNEV